MKYLIPLFSMLIMATSCNKNAKKTYVLGDEAFGGVVIQLDETKQHGLVVAKADQVTFAMHKNWNDSKAIVEAYTEGGEGWRLPTQTELELIYSSKASLSGFDNRDYWSSTLGSGTAWSKYFGSTMGGFTSSPWKALTNCNLCSRGVKEF
jgi:hypothetical protein